MKLPINPDKFEVLANALALIRESQQSTLPNRVFVPHMNQYGTVRNSYHDGKLIDVMLDDGIFMQTLSDLTQSVEDSIYKEESSKFPLSQAQAVEIAENVKTLQLSLF